MTRSRNLRLATWRVAGVKAGAMVWNPISPSDTCTTGSQPLVPSRDLKYSQLGQYTSLAPTVRSCSSRPGSAGCLAEYCAHTRTNSRCTLSLSSADACALYVNWCTSKYLLASCAMPSLYWGSLAPQRWLNLSSVMSTKMMASLPSDLKARLRVMSASNSWLQGMESSQSSFTTNTTTRASRNDSLRYMAQFSFRMAVELSSVGEAADA
mmetsp:Transcript_13043/g.31920  ORF Transcript_13043/g.31920 Transcript_13043/m.31920 type:complete len:209 (+) Transcript_13043:217-843(+)